jgi:hypothetical protein
MTTTYRIAIVGAASIRGKQLNEALSESSFAASEFVLMDDQQALGQLEAVGDEITFIQPITADSFERIDFTFFSGTSGANPPPLAGRAAGRLQHCRSFRGVGGRSRGAGVRTVDAGGDGRSGLLPARPICIRRPSFRLTPLRWCWPCCSSVCSASGPFARSPLPCWSRLRSMAGRRWTSCTSRR